MQAYETWNEQNLAVEIGRLWPNGPRGFLQLQNSAYEYCRDNSEAQQAQYLAQAFEMVKTAYPYVTNMFVWNLNFQQLVPEIDEKWGFGVIRPDGSLRPAHTALRVLAK